MVGRITVDAAARMYRDGATLAEVAAAAGLNHGRSVGKRLIAEGVRMRPPGRRKVKT